MRTTAAALGLGADALAEPVPELSAAAQLAAECWDWCDGWHPERWPLFDALHEVADWERLAAGVRAIRDAHREHDRREARERAPRAG